MADVLVRFRLKGLGSSKLGGPLFQTGVLRSQLHLELTNWEFETISRRHACERTHTFTYMPLTGAKGLECLPDAWVSMYSRKMWLSGLSVS